MNSHESAVLSILGVEVGWAVIIEKHLNDDAVEATDLRH
jgi:hypothetical protein